MYNVGSSNDEDLGIHVVGQRLWLGTPSTPPSSKSDNQTISQSVYKVRFENILFIIVISTTWYFWSSVNQSVWFWIHNYQFPAASNLKCSPLTPLCLSSQSPSRPPAKQRKHCVDSQEVLSGSRGPDQGDPVQGKKWGKEVQSERQRMRKKREIYYCGR